MISQAIKSYEQNKLDCLTLAEREEISRLLVNSSTFTEISKKLNRKSAILREVNRDGMDTNTYRAHKAHRIAQRNKKKQGRKRKIDQLELKEYVHQLKGTLVESRLPKR